MKMEYLGSPIQWVSIQFGEEIVCVTGSNNKVGNAIVTVQHGSTGKQIEHEPFTYTENPKIDGIQPKTSIRSGGRNITVTGSGFDIIQKFSVEVLVEPFGDFLSKKRRRRQIQKSQKFEGEVISKLNDTAIVFLSPPVVEDPESYKITTLIKMDGYVEPLQDPLQYFSDPTFENFTDGVKKQVNKLIHAKGSNLNKAMTIEEAQAFVGEQPCIIKTLTETDLYCEPPEVQPPPKRRQKRDTVNNLPEFSVKFGFKEWVLGRVEYTQVSDLPLSLILPLVLIPMVAIISISIYCYRHLGSETTPTTLDVEGSHGSKPISPNSTEKHGLMVSGSALQVAAKLDERQNQQRMWASVGLKSPIIPTATGAAYHPHLEKRGGEITWLFPPVVEPGYGIEGQSMHKEGELRERLGQGEELKEGEGYRMYRESLSGQLGRKYSMGINARETEGRH
uniref:Uncharacterized protein n=1 Tax=Sphaerodactylus townsendi TaxID=933632 RepID=A0ACB8FPP0_9SAUR